MRMPAEAQAVSAWCSHTHAHTHTLGLLENNILCIFLRAPHAHVCPAAYHPMVCQSGWADNVLCKPDSDMHAQYL